jgi:hypothetical protein
MPLWLWISDSLPINYPCLDREFPSSVDPRWILDALLDFLLYQLTSVVACGFRVPLPLLQMQQQQEGEIVLERWMNPSMGEVCFAMSLVISIGYYSTPFWYGQMSRGEA